MLDGLLSNKSICFQDLETLKGRLLLAIQNAEGFGLM